MAHELGMGMDDICYALTCERLFAETALDIAQNFQVRRVCLVENVPESKIRRAQAVAEMLRENPATICSTISKSYEDQQRRCAAYAQA